MATIVNVNALFLQNVNCVNSNSFPHYFFLKLSEPLPGGKGMTQDPYTENNRFFSEMKPKVSNQILDWCLAGSVLPHGGKGPL